MKTPSPPPAWPFTIERLPTYRSPTDPPRRVLIIRPSALGDVCRSVPALVSLRRAFPEAEIDWLVQEDFAPAIASHPDLTRVIPFARRELSSALKRGRPGPLLAFLRFLRSSTYDLVYDLQGLGRSGLFAWATRAPRRVGFANAREFGWLGANERIKVSPNMHTVERMLALLHASGVTPVRDMRLYVGEQDRLHILADPRLPSDGYAVLAPATRWPGKRWPDERFAQVAARLLRRGLKVAVVGARSERDQCGRVLDLADREGSIIDLVGKTTVGQLMALIQLSRMVIANDSAALHMAVGFEKPIIGLYGPTRVNLVGPFRREADVIQHITRQDPMDYKSAAAGQAMMKRITVDEVLLRLDAMMLAE